MGSKKLFFDLRHIQSGRLAWLNPDGEQFGTVHPPGQPVPMRAESGKTPRGLRLCVQPGAVTEPFGAWEGWVRIVYDEGMYRNWHIEVDGHCCMGNGAPAETRDWSKVELCCQESSDGFEWKTIHREPIDVEGQWHFDGQTFLIDPGAPEGQRYKFIYHAIPQTDVTNPLHEEYLKLPPLYQDERVASGGSRFCIYMLTSPDGIHWGGKPKLLMLHHSDTDTTVYYEEGLRKYVMYTRSKRHDRRWIGRAESDDCLHWSPVSPIIGPPLSGPMDHDVYLNAFTRYPDFPEYRLMFAMHFHHFTERSDLRLLSSDDGMVWQPVPGGSAVGTGPSGSWYSDFITGGKDLMPFGSDEIAIPVAGSRYPHKYPRWPKVLDAWQMGWAVWPKDRLCALKADREGECWTIPAEHRGSALRLNYRAYEAGQIRIGVEGAEDRSIDDCDPLLGDEVDKTVTWKGSSDPGTAQGQPAVLHIWMRDAELFSIDSK